MKRKVAIYARCSTNTGRQDVETQLLPLGEYVRNRGWTIYREYIDELSGATENRPQYQEMMRDARHLKFRTILTYRFDRFSRSALTLISAMEEFNSLGIDFVSYSENLDTTTPTGKAMYVICGAFAEMERAIIRERISAGLDKARQNGVRLGRPRKGFDIAQAIKLKSEGLGVRRIARRLGVSHGTVHNYLKSVQKSTETASA